MVESAEFDVYRTLASFSHHSSTSFHSSETEARKLKYIIRRCINICKRHGVPLTNELLNSIALTINRTLSNDQQSKYPQITGSALYVIYGIIKLLHDYNIHLWNRIHSKHFNQKPNQIYIFPGQPKKPTWEFAFRRFDFFETIIPKHCFQLDYVQHVVHDVNDVLKILLTYSGKAHFKGFSNDDYSGPSLCWFAPLPPHLPRNIAEELCDSLNRYISRYGFYRFIIPFKVLIQRFPQCYILGTRKYNEENSHAILLTEPDIDHIMFLKEQSSIKVTDTTFIRRSQNITTEETFEWLCFHDDPGRKWDQLEFAVAAKDLQFDLIKDNIRFEFVDYHSKICVPSLKKRTQCHCQWNKNTAIRNLLTEFTTNNIRPATFRQIFTDEAWYELQHV